MIPAICKNTSKMGNSKPMPNAAIILITNDRYLAGEKPVTKSSPPMVDRNLSARGMLQ